jgi:capsular polysaccharide biosynthesis protein
LGFREHYAVEELIYPSLPCRFPTAYTPPWVYHWLREQFKPWTQLEKVYPKRILVSRLKASYRRMVNEEDLLKRLKPYGFELVYLEDLSLKDQIGLFSQIEMVVAPHGSGLTNLVFASEGTKVIEIFPPYQDCSVCYATMCQTLQLEYTPIRISQEYIRNRSDFLVDTSLIEGLVWSSLKDSGIPVELEYAVSMIP